MSMKKLSVEFFEVKKVLNEKVLLKFFQENDMYFSYFQVKKNMYYLFLYYDNNESALSLPDNVCIVNILSKKKRRLRSLRGFLLYALEIIGSEEIQILATNLQPLFWQKVKNVLAQNRTDLLMNFALNQSTSIDLSLQIQINEMQLEILKLKQEIESLQDSKLNKN